MTRLRPQRSGARAAVAYVLQRPPRPADRRILNEIRAMERLGTRVQSFALDVPEDERMVGVAARARIMAAILRAHWLALRAMPRRYLRSLATVALWSIDSDDPLALWRRFARAAVLVETCRAQDIRHLHAHVAQDPTSVAHLAHLLSGISFSFTAHTRDIEAANAEVIRRQIAAAEFTVTCTARNAAQLRRMAAAIDVRKIRLIYHGVDLDTAAAAAVATRAAARTTSFGPPLILSVGKLVPKNGHADLIGACARLRDAEISFRCVIVGSGPLHDALVEEIRRHDLEAEVSLREPPAQEELDGLYRQARLFALAPRIADDGDRDGIPGVILEAMVRGVPVVATGVPGICGISELVHHERTGLLAPPRDPAAIAVAMQRLLTEPAHARVLADQARRLLRRDFNLWDTTRALRDLIACAAGDQIAPPAPAGAEGRELRGEACCTQASE